ncbi:GNAT family N-acetyltransferase [Kribbella sandramycini]|uniref:GNAT family N-acetyltransferase n=1 Tax=Kribbella sandramycini TaxID=60450 RepID=UPI003CD08477
MGYVVGPSSRWGQGLGSAIARLAVDCGFATLQLEAIDAAAAESNEHSIRILVGLGMTETAEQGLETYLGTPALTRSFSLSRGGWLRGRSGGRC